MINIVRFTDSHIDDAARIYVNRYRKSYENNPELSSKYLEIVNIKPYLEWITKEFYTIAAVCNDKLVGYYSGIVIDNFKSNRMGVYTPEWAYGVENEDIELFNLMYQTVLGHYARQKVSNFAITTLAHEKRLYDNLVWNGHGLLVVDAVRPLELISNINTELTVRGATKNDFEQLTHLLKEHNDYMRSENTFLYGDLEIESELTEWLNNDNIFLFVILDKNHIIGLMKTVIDGDDATTVIRDHSIIKIQTTHVKKEYQGKHVGATMLNHVIYYFLDKGFKAIAVDFESANLYARRFWLKHFKIVCYSLMRSIDDRIFE